MLPPRIQANSRNCTSLELGKLGFLPELVTFMFVLLAWAIKLLKRMLMTKHLTKFRLPRHSDWIGSFFGPGVVY